MPENHMMLSAHFAKEEFACGCGCGFGLKEGDVDPELVQILENIREALNRPVKINSGCRCQYHNHAVGGVPNSAHTRGTAVDIAAYGGKDRYIIVETAALAGAHGIGVAPGFIHVDMDNTLPRPALWIY